MFENKNKLKIIFSNRADFIIRLTAIALLWSHICTWRQWFHPDLMVSFFSLPQSFYLAFMILHGTFAGLVIFLPKLWPILTLLISCSVLLDINSLTEYTYNYFLLLIFSGVDRTLRLSLWLIAIQEIWAGLNKLNLGYAKIVVLFGSPFTNYPTVQTIVMAGAIIAPLLEILIGLGIIFRWKITTVLTFLIHGSAIGLLCFFLGYAEVVWSWNLLILILIGVFYLWEIPKWAGINYSQIIILIILTIMPLTHTLTTFTKPLSYRMYTGSEINFTIDQKSYSQDYYDQVKTLPHSSIFSFENYLTKQCKKRKFDSAMIEVPTYLWRVKQRLIYTCDGAGQINKSPDLAY